MKEIIVLIGIAMSSLAMKASDHWTPYTIQKTVNHALVLKPFDKKTQKKIDRTKADIARTQKTLDKKQTDHDKELARFEKKLAHGELSPNDVARWQKSFDKVGKEIEHLKKTIADKEKHLASLMK